MQTSAIDLWMASDVVEQAGQPELADVLRKMPPGDSMLRCIGGPKHGDCAAETRDTWNTATSTHLYVLTIDTWNGIQLKWYQWMAYEIPKETRHAHRP